MTIRDRARAARASGSDLLRAGAERRAAWLEDASEPLCRSMDPLGKEVRDALMRTTGLTPQMVDWGLRSTLETVRRETLLELVRASEVAFEDESTTPLELLGVVLAGNVFAATVRALFVPLLFGVPVITKVSSKESSFAGLLQRSLSRADSVLAAALQVVAFTGGDESAERSLFANTDGASVYGSDETIEAIRQRVGDRFSLLAHGHGLSAAVCGKPALSESQIERTIAAVALDVAAYDQRGCLSPQVIYVEEAKRGTAEVFAERLSREGLTALSIALPRGEPPLYVGAAQAQWRGTGEIEGSLYEGPDHAVVVKRDGPPRWSPGYRNVTVVGVASLAQAIKSMAPFEGHVKCIGVDANSKAELLTFLRRRPKNTAYACTIGSMQTPPFDAPADGLPPWQGLIRLKRR